MQQVYIVTSYLLEQNLAFSLPTHPTVFYQVFCCTTAVCIILQVKVIVFISVMSNNSRVQFTLIVLTSNDTNSWDYVGAVTWSMPDSRNLLSENTCTGMWNITVSKNTLFKVLQEEHIFCPRS